MELSKACIECIETLNHNGYDAYLVGGAVRNYLLNIPIQDYDITTNALPFQIKECFNKYNTIDIGIKHGTVVVIINHEQIEITTYRIDFDYINHRHPREVSFTNSLKEDCKRRDFTINAMCYHPTTGIVDYFNGQLDLNNKIIRAIGNPMQRFDEDALRILRAIRFSAQLDFLIEPITKQALFDCKDYLNDISVERIQDEFFKILLAPNCANQCFEYAKILEIFIPELESLNISHKKKNDTYIALSKSIPSIPIRFALLTHNLDELDLSNTVRIIMNRLKFSNQIKKQVLHLLSSINSSFKTKVDIKLFLQQSDVNFQNVCEFKSCIDESFDYSEVMTMYNDIINNQECYAIKQLVINGNNIKQLGISDRKISSILNDCLHQVILENVSNQLSNLIEYIKCNYL